MASVLSEHPANLPVEEQRDRFDALTCHRVHLWRTIHRAAAAIVPLFQVLESPARMAALHAKSVAKSVRHESNGPNSQ